MLDYIENACEEIDAAMFSGDTFHKKKERTSLRKYIGRWTRQMNEFEGVPEKVISACICLFFEELDGTWSRIPSYSCPVHNPITPCVSCKGITSAIDEASGLHGNVCPECGIVPKYCDQCGRKL